MIPRTKEQEQIVRWTNESDGPTPKQAAYARRHCFSDLILESRGTCLCTACKHTYRTKDTLAIKEKCPHCGKTLKVFHNHRKYTQREYFTVLTTKANMQVVEWYVATRTVGRLTIMFALLMLVASGLGRMVSVSVSSFHALL